MRIAVIGGGVIGVTSAWELLERGHDVTLLEANADLAAGASGDNGAQLSYSYVAPLAQPGLLGALPRLLLSADAPLKLHLRASAAQWLWCLQCLLACTARRARETTIMLLKLARVSHDALHGLLARLPIEMQFSRAGKLVVHRRASAWDVAQRQVQLLNELGCGQTLLTRQQCVDLEPALSTRADGLLGGIYTASDEVGDCRAFVTQLGAAVARRARLLRSTGLVAPVMCDGRIRAVSMGREQVEADAFVLAAGIGSRRFAAQIGLRLPVLGLKGYSTTLALLNRAGRQHAAPRVSITDYERRVVFARLGETLRVAGFLEIGARHANASTGATRHLQRCAQDLFPDLAGGNAAQISSWAGLRPATPSGVPMIGRTPIPGLWVNTGHGALGWTLACGSARLLAQQIGREPCMIDPVPFELPG